METIFDIYILSEHCFGDTDLIKKIIIKTVHHLQKYVPKIRKTKKAIKCEEHLHFLKNAVMYMVPPNSQILQLYEQNHREPNITVVTEMCRLFKILEDELTCYIEFL